MSSSSGTATVQDPKAPVESGPSPAERRAFAARLLKADKPVWIGRLVVLVLLLVLWHVAVTQGWILNLYAATPAETFGRLFELLGDPAFWNNLRVTLQETVVGWALGSALGLIVGLLLGRWHRAARVFDPYLVFMNATPKIALAPFFILWFGIDQTSKVMLAATIVFFIVQVPTQASVALVQPDLDTVATTMGATELQKFRMVVLPGIMPSVFGALRLALVYSLLAVVLGEFISSRQGLGQALITSTNQFDMPTAFALLIVLAALAVLINIGLAAVENHYSRWQSADLRGKTVRCEPRPPPSPLGRPPPRTAPAAGRHPYRRSRRFASQGTPPPRCPRSPRTPASRLPRCTTTSTTRPRCTRRSSTSPSTSCGTRSRTRPPGPGGSGVASSRWPTPSSTSPTRWTTRPGPRRCSSLRFRSTPPATRSSGTCWTSGRRCRSGSSAASSHRPSTPVRCRPSGLNAAVAAVQILIMGWGLENYYLQDRSTAAGHPGGGTCAAGQLVKPALAPWRTTSPRQAPDERPRAHGLVGPTAPPSALPFPRRSRRRPGRGLVRGGARPADRR